MRRSLRINIIYNVYFNMYCILYDEIVLIALTLSSLCPQCTVVCVSPEPVDISDLRKFDC